ncbi:phage tail tape measure protein [Mycolicibacterium peregrinum]
MSDIGYYTLPVIASFEGIDQQVNSTLGKTLDAAGVKGGKQFAKGVAGGVRSGEADVKRALEQYSNHYEKLKDKAEDSLGKIRTAEAQLAQARNSGNEARIIAAEERVATARRNSTRATRDAENALKDYERAAKDAENAGKDLGTGLQGGFMAGLRGAAGAAKDAGSEAGSGFVAGFAPSMSKLGGKGGAIGVGLLATVGVYYAIGKEIAQQTMAGLQHEFAADQVQAQIGLDDQQMKVVSGAAGKAYANNFGASVEENLDVAKVAFQTGLLDPNATQGEIQKFVEQMNTVAAVTGEDAQAIARSVSQAVKTGMVPDVESGFDLIVKAQQKGLNASEDILDTVNEYSTQFRKLGIDGPTALGLINQGLKGGARDADVVADALKEFSIRSIDGSKATGEAYTALGLNIDETSQKLAAGGPVAAQTFDTILDKLRAIEDPVKRNQIGVALFGTQWEDLGAAVNNLDLSNATQQLGEVEGATQRASDTMGNNAVGSIESAKRSIEVAARGIQDSLAEAFGPQIAEWANVVSEHQPQIIGFFVSLADIGLGVLQDLVKSIGGAVVAFGQLVGGVGNTLGRITQGIALVNDALGRHEIADQLRKDAEAQFGWGESIVETGRDIERGADKMGTYRERIREQGEEAQRTSRANIALGDSVKLLPDGKTITITDNTPETQQKLDDVGLKIETLPDGTFVVVANTEEGQRDLDAWREQQTGKPVEVTVEPKVDPTKAEADMKAFFDKYPVLNPNGVAPSTGPMYGPFAAPPGGFQPPPSGSAPKPRSTDELPV